MENHKRILFLFLGMILFLLLGCVGKIKTDPELWGSFTPNKTYSYDKKYYAVQKVGKDIYRDGFKYIKVSIYETKTNTLVEYFYQARAWDFWGICQENDTYNIWIQSADIGIYCYKYEDDQWKEDASAERPEYIVSKYDKYDWYIEK